MPDEDYPDLFDLAEEEEEEEEYVSPESIIRSKLFKELEAGKDQGCPVCGQYCKIYKRKLNSAMAMAIAWLVYHSGDSLEWVNVTATGPKWIHTTRPLPTLSHWDMIEAKLNEDTKKRTSGIWRPTYKGAQFVKQHLRVPSHVYIYNKQRLGFSSETININEVLGSDFNYSELMGQ